MKRIFVAVWFCSVLACKSEEPKRNSNVASHQTPVHLDSPFHVHTPPMFLDAGSSSDASQ
jgi:hypothetical protein